jgi:hypothetical protein
LFARVHADRVAGICGKTLHILTRAAADIQDRRAGSQFEHLQRVCLEPPDGGQLRYRVECGHGGTPLRSGGGIERGEQFRAGVPRHLEHVNRPARSRDAAASPHLGTPFDQRPKVTAKTRWRALSAAIGRRRG